MDHHSFLEQALDEALIAKKEGQNPIGCVIIDRSGKVVARAHNQVEKLKDPTAHAEMLAIRSTVAGTDVETRRAWILYTTIEPCPMCMGTILLCNIGTVVWAAPDRRMETHKLLSANPYMRKKKLIVIPAPFSDLEEKCSKIHDEYWTSRGRPDAVRPILENGSVQGGNGKK